ncbi:hypothetical protein TRIP_B50699 [uncultured Desulfatiglans sp.]|uniref:Uncharacterized protein n=1 Tax=Uncultured Desulfatiglans sp. TaxID=1748965 RepID=A0A653AIK1_UNCDX|nr:hypothetical protein TRIP_B50699 [uncultured Desulfatiglans sp.]
MQEKFRSWISSFHPEMVFLANLGVNLHVCLCGDLQVASGQTLDFLDIGQKSSFPDWKLSPTAKSFPDGNYLDHLEEQFSSRLRGYPHVSLERPAFFSLEDRFSFQNLAIR